MPLIPKLVTPTSNEEELEFVIRHFHDKITMGDLVFSPDGDVTAEIIGAMLRFDPFQKELVFGNIKKTNTEYVERELAWYLSQSLNIVPMMQDIAVWKKISGKNGEICSNYGWAIFSEENGNQYNNCRARLLGNPDTKRGVMIYTRPSMWEDCKKNGMNDFMCTDGVQCHIVDGKLVYIVKQRSCDFIYGLFNDLAWHQFVYLKLFADLQAQYSWLHKGVILFYPFNLHVYSRHFNLIGRLKDYIDSKED